MEITIPHKFNPREYQLPLLKAIDRGVKRAVIVWNRRSGKDKTCFNIMIKKALERKGTYYYFLPTYSHAKKVVWDNIDNNGFKMLDHIPRSIIRATNATELKIELINGSIIQLIGADVFKKSGVGTNPIGVVFSEYSITNPDAWKYVSPILAVNEGWVIFNFTPRGLNHAWDILQQAKDNDKWFWEVLTVNETQILTDEALEEEKKNHPQDFFEQEYYCKFIEGAGQFFRGIDELKYDNHSWRIDNLHRYQMGIDLAKYNDYTVITVIDLMTFCVVEQDRFNQIDWNLQKAKVEAMYLKYNKPITYLDSTGLGDPIYDDLVNKGLGNIVSFKITEQSRKDLLTNLQLIIEQRKIGIPETYTELFEELRSFQYSMTDNGKIRIQVPEGLHDDTVFSLALACWGLPQNPMPMPNSIRTLTYKRPIQPNNYE